MQPFLPFHSALRLLVILIALTGMGCRNKVDLVLTYEGKASAHVDFVMEVLADTADQTIVGKTDAKGSASIVIDDWRDADLFWFSVKQPDATQLQVSSGGLKNGRVLFQSDQAPYSLTL